MALALLYCHAPSSRAEPVRILIAVMGSGALSAVGARDICSDVLPLPAAKRSDHPRRLNPSLWSSSEQRSEEHTSELQSRPHLVCRLLLEKKNARIPSLRGRLRLAVQRLAPP